MSAATNSVADDKVSFSDLDGDLVSAGSGKAKELRGLLHPFTVKAH